MPLRPTTLFILPVVAAALTAGCGGEDAAGGSGRPGGSRGGAAPWAAAATETAAVPVETAPVERRDISSYIETQGVLEAENEVDIVARVSAPIVELLVEEGMAVQRGQLLARLEEDELRAQLEIAKVALAEARLAWDRAQALDASQLISSEEFEEARTRFETARAELEGTQIQLGYTELRAPFSGLIVARYVDFAQQVGPGTALFRLSDFDPLLCPIQVPERDLARLSVGQRAYLEVEAWRGERFDAEVLRIRPVVDAATGTVRVTLAVRGRGKLRPGMFADVFVETDRRSGSLVIPKTALTLDSIGDTVYVAEQGKAARRDVQLGFSEGDFVEVTSGLAEGEQVVVVGQDGLSDGTPVQRLGEGGAPPQTSAGGPGGRFDPSQMSDEQKERARQFLRRQGLSDEQIEERLSGGGPAQAAPAGPATIGGSGPGGPPGGFDPAELTPERLEQIKQRMRERGLSEEQIEERLARMRERRAGGGG